VTCTKKRKPRPQASTSPRLPTRWNTPEPRRARRDRKGDFIILANDELSQGVQIVATVPFELEVSANLRRATADAYLFAAAPGLVNDAKAMLGSVAFGFPLADINPPRHKPKRPARRKRK
jgi:hypothetical protein